MTRSPVWHPFTQHGLNQPIIPIARAEGAWLETADGSKLLDAISSWWVVTHGHRHPAIVSAIRAQADRLDQVIFAGFTHEPAEQLARDLIAVAPPGLAHVFYSDSGSTAVEVGLKMALGYWRNVGRPRHKIVALEHAYHGDTVGTMSVGARGVFTASFEALLFEVVRIPFPYAGREEVTLAALTAALRNGTVAGVVVEPLILGAGGMMTYPADVLARIGALCVQHETLLIADEVMTGWGRTGTLFACEQAGITPDILCTAKGLTGGSLPLAATLCVPKIFDAHISDDRSRMFFHSSSYTANPIACAAAVANLAVWRDEPVGARVQALCALQTGQGERFAGDTRFAGVRQCGTITALDLKVDGEGYLASVAPQLSAFFIERGVLLRPLGNTIYVMPPYCVTGDELAVIYDAILAAADQFGAAS
jgi:adenosylmethionine---8-amino-7-oxononanoate aminotransferase